jgi:glutamate/tyrosine decarboxylase-like PLP-dependent enzyme
MSDEELNRLNERVMALVQKGGRAYVSNATVRGRFALRACITNFRTTKADIDATVAAIRDAGRIA